MLDGIWRGKEWIFSGIGVFVPGGAVWVIRDVWSCATYAAGLVPIAQIHPRRRSSAISTP